MDGESDKTCLKEHETKPYFKSMSAELLLAENKKLKEHLEEAQRLAHIGSWDLDIIHGEVYWSDECYRIYGFEPQSFKPEIMQFLEYVHPKDREKVREAVNNASTKGIPYKINFRIVRPDGSICHAFSKAQLDRDETGRLTRLYGTVQDITKRKLDEAEKARIRANLEEAQRIAHMGSWEWDIPNNTVICSEEVSRITGIDPARLHKGITYNYMNDEDRQRVEEAHKLALSGKAPYEVEYTITTPDGRTVHIYSRGRVRFDAEGKPLSMFGYMQDITEQKLAERELKRREEMERLILDSVNDGVGMYDREGIVINVNKHMAESYGATVQSVIGRSIKEFLPEDKYPDQYERRIQRLRKIIDDGKPAEFEDCKDGKWYCNRFFPIYRDGKACAVTLFSTDITDQRRVEEEIRRHTAFENTVLMLTKDLINCPTDTIDKIITESMKMICEYYDADRATVYRYDWEQEKGIRLYKWTCNPEFLADERWAITSFDAIKDVIECHRKGLPYRSDTIDDVSPSSTYYPTAQKSKAQSVISIPLMTDGKASGAFTISSTKERVSLPDTDISIINVFGEILTNVLLRKEREKTLREANESNKLMLDSTSDGIAMYDREGLILNINDNFAKRFGKSKQECIGKDFKDFLPASRYQDLYNRRYIKLQKVLKTGEPETDEDERDGAAFFNRYHPVFKNGEVHAVTIFSTDITDRKRAEEEARAKAESEARLKVTTELFTNVSHEFKTPLSVILIQLELMKLYLDDTQKMMELIDAATQNSYRLNRLVGNLLDITKIDSGFMRVNMTHTDIVATIREICESVGDYAKARGIQLSFASETITRHMPVDMDKIERIVLNLLSNAIKHTHAEGNIDVILEDKGGAVLIRVKDTGEGIPKEKQAVIFDRFAQVDTSLTRKNEGSGIGLALVHSFVKLLGGRIWVESEPGMGSTFFIELPVLQESQTALPIEMEGYSLKRKVEMELSDLYI